MDDYRYGGELDISFGLYIKMSQNTFDRAAQLLPHSFMRALFTGRHFFDVYLCNGSDFENPDCINIVIASDSASVGNNKLLEGMAGDTVSMFGINRGDCFFCTGINRVPAPIGTKSNRCVDASVFFALEPCEDTGAVPDGAAEIVYMLPNIHEKRESDKIKHWDEYLKINEQIAAAEERVIPYSGVRRGGNRSKAVFEIEPGHLIPSHIGASVCLVSGVYEEDGETVYRGDIIGQISSFTADTLTAALDPEFQSNAEDFEKSGILHITKHGDLVQIKRLRRGLQRFSRGQAVNPYLDLFMFNSRKARDIDKRIYLDADRLLLKRLNAEQKAAVEGALSAKDLFLIQGPPGTGKTTAIAEICYQNALEGKRTLIASQTNLAVDNVLSRLVHDPKIRALRKGSAAGVQEEGLPFTEDKVIATWLSKTAESCTENLDKHKETVKKIEETEKRLVPVIAAHKIFISGMTQRNKYLSKAKMLKNLLDTGKRDFADFETEVKDYAKSGDDAVVRRAAMFELGDYSFDKEKIRRLEILSGEVSVFKRSIIEKTSLTELLENSLKSASEWKKETEHLLGREVEYAEKTGNVLTKTEIMMTYGGLFDSFERQLKSKPKKLAAAFGFAGGWRDGTINLLSGIYQFIKDCEATRIDADKFIQDAAAKGNIEGKSEKATKILNELCSEYENKLKEMERDAEEAEAAAEKICADTAEAKRIVTDFDKTIEYERADIETAIFKDDIESYYKSLWHDDYANSRAYVRLVDTWIKRIQLQNSADYEEFKQLYISNANVIGVTCSGSGTAEFEKNYPEFDVAIIDEVSKATPPELILPVLKAKKLVLVGDHKQLPPMIGSDTYEEVSERLGAPETEHMKVSLFEELYINAPDSLKVMLSRQYRMHSDIMDTVNRFYADEGGLICGTDNSARRHSCGGGVISEDDHAVWVDIPRDDNFCENKSQKNFSYSNEYEVKTIKNILLTLNSNLDKNGFPGKKEIGVITFYSNQVSLLEDALLGDFSDKIPKISLRIGSVDKFQGIEKPVIICSFVRNNDFGDIGFAKDPRRINVALSRAQELLMIVGCRELFCRWNADYAGIYKTIEEKGGAYNAVDFNGIV